MARIKFGHGVADARGKVGGTVFSRNASGAYMREKVSPVNPNTPRQNLIRTHLADLSKAWANLTLIQREGWAQLAQAYPRRDVFGNPLVLSGIAQYQACNGALLNADLPLLSDPPADLEIGELSLDTIGISAGTRSIEVSSFTPAPPATDVIVVDMTPRVSPGVTFVKNLYRFLGVSDLPALDPTTIPIPPEFGPIVQAQFVYVRIRLLRSTNGALSVGIESRQPIGS